MFFMAKSALCIGIVAVVAAGSAGGGTVRTTLETSGREAAASLGRACAASKDCLGLGTRIAAAAIGQPGMVPDVIARAGLSRVARVIPRNSASPSCEDEQDGVGEPTPSCLARAADALAAPETPIPTASAPDAGRPPHHAERLVRRSLAARD